MVIFGKNISHNLIKIYTKAHQFAQFKNFLGGHALANTFCWLLTGACPGGAQRAWPGPPPLEIEKQKKKKKSHQNKF